MNCNRVVAALRERRGNRSQQAFAEEIGASQQAISLILSGERGIGRDLGVLIIRRYPELRDLIVDSWLAAEDPAA